MTDTAAASLLVEVASGNKTYQYYIETQDPVGEDGTLTVNPEDIANVLMMAEQTIQAEGRGVSEEHSSVGQEVLGVTIQSEGGTLIEDHSMSVGQEVVGVTIQGEGGTEGVGVEQGIVIDYSQQDSQSGSVLVESVYSSHEGETIQETETIQEGETIIVQGKDTTQETNMVVQRTRTLEFGSIESNY